MSERDKQIVAEYTKMFAAVFTAPHLQPLPGNWYLFQKEGSVDFISFVDEDGCIDGDCADGIDFFTTVLGYTITPLLIYKVDTSKVR